MDIRFCLPVVNVFMFLGVSVVGSVTAELCEPRVWEKRCIAEEWCLLGCYAVWLL
jgi:hypothetical protein